MRNRGIRCCGLSFTAAVLASCLLFSAADSFARDYQLKGSFEGQLITDQRSEYNIDGDSFWVKTTDGKNIEVRLAEIDSPEWGQPFGRQATQILIGLAKGRQLTVKWSSRDRFKRYIAYVFVNDKDRGTIMLNSEMVRLGAAWVYLWFVTDKYCTRFATLQKQARLSETGVWNHASTCPVNGNHRQSDKQCYRVPPWMWRDYVKHMRLTEDEYCKAG